MTASVAPFSSTATPRALPAHRVLGALGILAAPAFPIMGPWAVPSSPPLHAQLLMLVYLAGWACSAVGMRRLRATGSGRGARTLFVVQLTALALAALQNVQDLLGRRPLGRGFYFATDMAWPFSHVFMLAIFAAVWRANVWTGWRRWAPFVCGIGLPLTLAAAGVQRLGVPFPSPDVTFPWGTTLGFAWLGLAVATSPRRAAA